MRALLFLLTVAPCLLVQSSHPATARKSTGLAQKGAHKHSSRRQDDDVDDDDEPVLTGTSNGNQAPSVGQDLQECGFVRLPSKIELSPRVSETFVRGGVWANTNGAILVNWQQKLYGYSFENAYFEVDEKTLFKTEVLQSEFELGPDLPVPPLEDEKQATTILLKDCEEVILYLLRQKNGDDKLINIYNMEGRLVAQSARSEIYPKQLQFYDEYGKPLAYAQSPFVTDKVLAADISVTHPDGIEPWEVIFADEFQSNSSLSLSQNRWVIAAAVQEIALRDSFLAKDGSVDMPKPWDPRTWTLSYVLFNAFCLFVIWALIKLWYATGAWIYYLVYPSKQELIENPFLRDPYMYGALPNAQRA